jgi:precorrin-6A/cobalt-precorrin-6A reductase
MRVLVLGGTLEASKLASLLAGQSGISAVLSFAGRTKAPRAPEIPYRTSGFGGVDGLEAYLETERIDVLVDATHPFAEHMPCHAAVAAARAKIPLVCLSRPAWHPEASDRWIDVGNMATAAAALGNEPKRVFLTIGRLQIEAFAAAPQHIYLIRAIEPLVSSPNLPHHRVILGRGPFTLEAEEKLLREESIEVIVTKNSGGDATFAKLLAARALGLPVVMVARPRQAPGPVLLDPAEVMEFLFNHQRSLRHRGTLTPRGV